MKKKIYDSDGAKNNLRIFYPLMGRKWMCMEDVWRIRTHAGMFFIGFTRQK